MTIYDIIIISSLIGVLASVTYKTKLAKVFLYVTSITMVLSVCLRYDDTGGGNDTSRYLEYFMKPYSNALYYSDISDYGYIIWNRAVGCVWHNKYFFSFLTSFIPYFLILRLGYRYVDNKNFFLFLILNFSVGASFYFLSFSMLRQFMALGIWCVVLDMYVRNDRRVTKGLCLAIVLMLSFHSTSLLCVILMLLDKVRVSKKKMVIISILSYLSGMVVSYYVPYLNALGVYLDRSFYLTSNLAESTFNPMAMLPYLATLFSVLYVYDEEYCNSIYVKGLFYSVVIAGLLNSLGTNLDRILMYYYVPSFIAISALFGNFKGKRKVLLPVFIGFMAYFTYKFYINLQLVYEGTLLPYKSCFD